MSKAQGIGDRLREARKRRGFTQRELAQLSGVSVSLVRKLEQGELADTRVETARKLAVTLGVRTTELIAAMTSTTSAIGPDSIWEPLRHVLANPGQAEREPSTPEGVEHALTAAVRLYHDYRYADLAVILPALLRDAEDAPPLLYSRVLQLAGSLLVQTRQREPARIALDRSLSEAQASGSVLDAASCVITQCWLLLLERQFGTVETLATRWADQIEPRLSRATRAELSTWGWLLLRASAAAIRDNRVGEAAEAMRLAEAAAVAIGPERGSYHVYWTTFGPATVAMKKVENAVVDGRPDVALTLAESVPSGLRATSDNRNRHLLDVSASHLDLRQYAASFDVLHLLSREAPVWLASQRMAADLLTRIIGRRRTLTPQMRELAGAMNLAL